ncbi:MAG: hypothetical protein ACRDSI_14495 [Pseudonocardiaceae bacterium]
MVCDAGTAAVSGGTGPSAGLIGAAAGAEWTPAVVSLLRGLSLPLPGLGAGVPEAAGGLGLL